MRSVPQVAPSQNPVLITIAPSSAGACSVSGGTVTFTGTGVCRIEADQAGNGEYAAAPQAEQAVTVSKPPVTSRQIAVLLATEIIPSKGLRIRSLLKAGGYTVKRFELKR
jgi:hypothetical protein